MRAVASGKRKKKKKKSAGGLQKLAVLVAGAALAVCVASAAVGVMNWYGGDDVKKVGGVVRIEILNGTGEKGLARKVALALIKKKIDVLHVDNAESFDYEKSVLIARSENPEVGTLGRLIGCQVVEQLKDETMVDATFIIGEDFRTLDIGVDLETDLSQ